MSLENWDEVWRRNQFLCAGLVQRYPHCKILFVGLARDVSHRLRQGRFLELWQAAAQPVCNYSNITFTQPLKIAPNTLGLGRRINTALMCRQLQKAAATLQMHAPLLWINDHAAGHLVGQLGERGVVYDITDDWTSLTQSPALTRRIAAQDERLCRRADAVIVCSERLWELKLPFTTSLHLIANGVDAVHYAQVSDYDGTIPAITRAWTHPVLGYVGTLHPDRVDVTLLEALARSLPQATIALIGPNHLSAQTQARLQQAGNVVFTGPVPYAQVPEYMRAFDVCLTPHCLSPFTESLNPIKLWEYLAAGKPIVSTRVAGFRDYASLVYLADNAAEFAHAITQAMAERVERPTLAEERKAEARRHSWNTRLDAVEAVIQGCRSDHVYAQQ